MALFTLLFVLNFLYVNEFFYYCLFVLSCGRTNLRPSPTSHVFTNTLITVPVGIIISNFYLFKIIFCVMLLIRLLIYASVIVVSSVRFIPFNLNLNLRPKTLEAFNFNSQIETIYFLIPIIDSIDTSIILFIFDQEMFQLKPTNYWLPLNTYCVSCVHTFIKITSFICLLICLSYLSTT